VIVPSDALAGLLALIRQAAREGTAEALAAHTKPPPSPRLLDRRGLAEELRVSVATVTRLTSEGMPCTHVGDAPRYEFETVKGWLSARGPKPTTATRTKRDIVPGVRLLSKPRRA
jgi:hypothetical protein